MTRVLDDARSSDVVYLSYLQKDEPYAAKAIYENLVRRFGRDSVFQDVSSLSAGDHFPDRIRTALDRTAVLVVLIGPRWKESLRETSHIHDEIRVCLDREIPIIPVYANVPMLRESDLPDAIKALALLQGLEVRPRSLSDDIDRLVDAISRVVPSLGNEVPQFENDITPKVRESQLLEELKKLTRGRGLDEPGLNTRIGPELSRVLDATPDMSEEQLRYRALAFFRQIVGSLEPASRLVAAAILNLEPSNKYRTLSARTEWAAQNLHLSQSTVRRRSSQVLRAIVDAINKIYSWPPARQFGFVVPGFASEVPTGPDMLGIEQDATAISALLASTSFTPPIAIGLFGEWGSGKTFLMKTIERNIRALTTSSSPGFCRRVVGVWFNAWHYAESNLWASLIHTIFSSLHGRESKPEQLLDAALAKVVGIQEAKNAAAAEIATAHRATERARVRVQELETLYDAAKADAAKIRAKDVWNSIAVDPELRSDLTAAAKELRLPEAGESAKEVARVAEEVRAVAQRSTQLATAGTWWKSPLALGLIAALMTAGLVIGLNAFVRWINPEFSALIGQISAIGAGAVAWTSRQAQLARRLLAPAERIQQDIESRLSAVTETHRAENERAEQNLSKAEATLAAAQDRLEETKAREDEARNELQELNGVRLLEKYLSERVGSADYQRYLGVVALAHRDLRDLDDYLRAAAGGDEQSIDRIVLYVDDLDRCPPETVIRVLEAVHLLLALPTFAVVVGVDVRWLVRSLHDRHPLLLTSDETAPSSADDPITLAGPSDYLDKIFQLTYQLPIMSVEHCVALLHHTAISTQPSPTDAPEGDSEMDSTLPDSAGLDAPTLSKSSELSAITDYDADTNSPPSTIDSTALILTAAELDILQQIAPLVGSSPRRAKRYLNIYRVSKARTMMDTNGLRLNYHALMVLSALAVGLPESVPGTLERTPSNDRGSLVSWLTALDPRTPAEASRLATFINSATDLTAIPMNELMSWLPIVRKFAWPMSHNSHSMPNSGDHAPLDT